MAKSQQYSASVNFGATIDSSVDKTLNRLTGGIENIGEVSLKTMGVQTKWMRELQSGSASTATKIKKMESATSELLKKQAELEKEIREGVKTGRAGTAFLVNDYQKVGVAIKRATDELEKLNKEQEKEQKRAKRAERFRNGSIAFGKGIGRGLGKGSLWGVSSVARGMMTATKWAGAGLLGGAAAAVASPIALNAETAESAGLAKSYGLSIKQYQGMGILARQAGLNAENGGDLAEEFVNKLKEQGNEKTLNPMLLQLGYNKTMLSKMSRQDAFNAVMSKLSRMKDTGAAASLADQLMGGEANKFLTYIHSTGKSFEEAMSNAQRYNLLTQEGADGAMQANTAVGNLWGVAVTGMEDTVGKITGKLAPTVDNAALQLSDWIKGIQPKITDAVSEWMKPDENKKTGPQRLWDSVVKFGNGVEMVADEIMAVAAKLKWLLPDNRGAADMDSIQEARQKAIEIEEKKQGVNMLGYQESINIANEGEKAWRDAHSHTNTPDYVGFDDSTFGGPVPGTASVNPQQQQLPPIASHNAFTFYVTLAPGTTEEQAQSLHDQFKQLVGNTSAYSPAYDTPQ